MDYLLFLHLIFADVLLQGLSLSFCFSNEVFCAVILLVLTFFFIIFFNKVFIPFFKFLITFLFVIPFWSLRLYLPMASFLFFFACLRKLFFLITTLESFCSISIDITFCPNLYVYVDLIPLFPITYIWHFLKLNLISQFLLHSYILFI